MIYPFVECSDWFKDQPHKNKRTARGFNEAMNEETMIEQGIMDKERLLECSSSNECELNCGERSHTSQDQPGEGTSDEKRPCSECAKEKRIRLLIDHEGQTLCKRCIKLKQPKDHCSTCKRIRYNSRGGKWARCNGVKLLLPCLIFDHLCMGSEEATGASRTKIYQSTATARCRGY